MRRFERLESRCISPQSSTSDVGLGRDARGRRGDRFFLAFYRKSRGLGSIESGRRGRFRRSVGAKREEETLATVDRSELGRRSEGAVDEVGVEMEEAECLRRASNASASSWRTLARRVEEKAPKSHRRTSTAVGKQSESGERTEPEEEEDERFVTLSDRLQATREETLRMEEFPELKRQKKLEETNDASKVWALAPGQSTVAATAAPFLKWCEEHFRGVTKKDIESIAPSREHDIEKDADYLTPPLGRHYIHGWETEDREREQERLERKRAVAAAAARKPDVPAKKKTPKKSTPKPRQELEPKNYQITRISPLENPEEIAECCGVCFDGDSYDENPILFCDKCDVAVHQSCYGIKKVPEGDWLCKACSARGGRKSCCLCTVPGGALKPTVDGRWAHLFCAQWIPELFISDLDAMEPIENTKAIVHERLQLTCADCKQHGVGACIQCAYGACAVPFHPMCALVNGTRMEVRSTETSPNVEYLCYCEKHVKEMTKRAQRLANGETESAVATPSATPAKQEKSNTPPAASKEPAEIKEESKEESRTPEKRAEAPNVSADYPMSELDSKELRKLVKNLFDISGISAADIDNVDDDEFNAWLCEDPQEDAMYGSPGKTALTKATMNRHELAARQWISQQCLAEIAKPVSIIQDERPVNNVSDSAMETAASSPSDEKKVTQQMGEDNEQEAKLYPPLVPHPIECLAEYTRLTLDTMPVPALPKSVEEVIPDPPGPNGLPPGLRPPKCEVCVIRKQGVCGTASAPPRCLRRRENIAKARAAERAEREARGEELPDPLDVIKSELERLEGRTDLLHMAPDDEVVAEIYRAQTALARTSFVNRELIQKLLSKVEPALAEEEEAREEQQKALDETAKYEERWRGGRWRMERLRAEGKEDEARFDGGELAGADMCDPLVESGAMEDALCCVCAGGESEYPNEIVFCERCEMCVHQQCYGVTNIPEGEWLCWPCHETERIERENGLPGTRPPRYMREAGDGAMYDPRVTCLLCPVKRGALRCLIDPRTQTPMTANAESTSPLAVRSPTSAKSVPEGKCERDAAAAPVAQSTPVTKTPTRGRNRWCHVVCAHWQQGMETDLYLDGPSAVSGLEDIRPQFKNARCSACRLDDGACIPCSATGCSIVFHPLCARRCGWHMLPLQSPEPLAFCARHSVDERRSPGSSMKVKFSANASGARFGQRVSSKKKRLPTLEEMEMLRRARVGLETLRLLCDRIVKREKLKRLELEQHHKLWLDQIKGTASGPVYELGDDTQAHIKVPDIANERKLIFLGPEQAKQFELEFMPYLPADIRLVQAEPESAIRNPE